MTFDVISASFNAWQSENISAADLSYTHSFVLIFFKPVLENALLPTIFGATAPIFMSTRFSQSENALAPIFRSSTGNLTDDKSSHPANAPTSISWTLFPNLTLVRILEMPFPERPSCRPAHFKLWTVFEMTTV